MAARRGLEDEMLRKLAIAGTVIAALASQALPAAACGGLVAPNGAIRLSRATTFVYWRDGVERYFTSFSYQGSGFTDFGWIVPLPAVPTKVEEGGGWTLQRLNRETHPPIEFDGAALQATSLAAPRAATVLLTTTVRAQDNTVLKGSGDEIAQWCRENGFLLTPDTRNHLALYAKGSPIFMAAKYDVARAEASRQIAGDGAPVLITMPLAHPWIPLEVLANGTDQVGADIYVITQDPLSTADLRHDSHGEGTYVDGAPGLQIQSERRVTDQLFRDLSSDKNMGWMKPGGWLTFVTLDAPASSVVYDMGISPAGEIRVAPFGTPPMEVASYTRPLPGPGVTASPSAGRQPWLWLLLAAAIAALGLSLRRLLRPAS
jgi:hypothetical protein